MHKRKANAILGLGTNMGDKHHNILIAIRFIEMAQIKILKQSDQAASRQPATWSAISALVISATFSGDISLNWEKGMGSSTVTVISVCPWRVNEYLGKALVVLVMATGWMSTPVFLARINAPGLNLPRQPSLDLVPSGKKKIETFCRNSTSHAAIMALILSLSPRLSLMSPLLSAIFHPMKGSWKTEALDTHR